MKNPFSYLTQAPIVPGFRILRPDEKARRGDRFIYLGIRQFADNESLIEFIAAGASPISGRGFIRSGRTLRQARLSFNRRYRNFDGVIYRLT